MKGRTVKIDIVHDYIRDIDRTLLRENRKLTFEQRAQKHLRCRKWLQSCGTPAKKVAEHRLKVCVPSGHVVCCVFGAK
jgi:hypothetical protein